jgi:hypothetical protein
VGRRRVVPNETSERQREDCAHTHTKTRTAEEAQGVTGERVAKKEGGRSSSVEMAGQASAGGIRGSVAEISVATYFGEDANLGGVWVAGGRGP